jgi:hypothetical protein
VTGYGSSPITSSTLEAYDHMNHHYAGIAGRDGEALDSIQERLLVDGIGIDHHSLEIHQEKSGRFWFDSEFVDHGHAPMFHVACRKPNTEAAIGTAHISR